MVYRLWLDFRQFRRHPSIYNGQSADINTYWFIAPGVGCIHIIARRKFVLQRQLSREIGSVGINEKLLIRIAAVNRSKLLRSVSNIIFNIFFPVVIGRLLIIVIP